MSLFSLTLIDIYVAYESQIPMSINLITIHGIILVEIRKTITKKENRGKIKSVEKNIALLAMSSVNFCNIFLSWPLKRKSAQAPSS